MDQDWGFKTLLVYGGLEPGPAGVIAIPIVQSSVFACGTDDLILRPLLAGHFATIRAKSDGLVASTPGICHLIVSLLDADPFGDCAA